MILIAIDILREGKREKEKRMSGEKVKNAKMETIRDIYKEEKSKR